MSMPRSRATRRALGEENRRPLGEGTAAGGASPTSRSQPIRAPGGSSAPDSTAGWNRPDPSASTSTSTLSVASLSSGSPGLTGVPGATSHSSISPYSMVSPSLGIRTSTATSAPGALEQPPDSGHDPVAVRDVGAFEHRAERHRGERRAEAEHRRVQVVERLLLDLRGDLGADAAEGDRLVHDQGPVRPADGFQDGRTVERLDGAHVDHLDLGAFLG